MQPPRYVPDERALARVGAEVRRWACPHCRQVGHGNRHGALRGLAEDGATKTAVRGRRFFCSNRGRRRGCGRTWSVWFTTVLQHATVRTGTLWRFYAARLQGQSVAAAWLRAGGGFALETAYGWWRRWRRGESAVRTHLSRNRDPPAAGWPTVLMARYGAADPIAGFQGAEQTAWP